MYFDMQGKRGFGLQIFVEYIIDQYNKNINVKSQKSIKHNSSYFHGRIM
jgi:hypothetical protein